MANAEVDSDQTVDDGDDDDNDDDDDDILKALLYSKHFLFNFWYSIFVSTCSFTVTFPFKRTTCKIKASNFFSNISWFQFSVP